MSINQEATRLLEENDYEGSLKLFKKAVEVSRDVQSLTNLAWIYCNEEYEDDIALSLVEEAIDLNPSSHFPYNLLGEIYIRQEKWSNAKDVLQKAIAIHPTIHAYNNLAVSFYHLGEVKEATEFYRLASEDSGYAMYSYVYCLIKLGETQLAESILSMFSQESDEFVGEINVAELYMELGLFNEAADWFEKGWKSYWKDTDWVSRYVYTLLKLNKMDLANKRVKEVIQEKLVEIKEVNEEESDDYWPESEKQEDIKNLKNEIIEYEQMCHKMLNAPKPDTLFDTSIKRGCYLFGCKYHNHPEYNK